MLSVNDFIDINYIPTENDISLKLLVEFYENYLCKRFYVFTLRNGQVVKMAFKNATELFHLSGIDHIYEGTPMDASNFVRGVRESNIDLATVKNINAAAYKDYEIRIRSIACIDTIIKNCEYLWFPSGKIQDSDIDVKYLLLKGLDGKNLHLGIDTYKESRPYFARTLLITEGNNADKFIAKADERFKVSKLEIRDKSTNELLVFIQREEAESLATLEIEKRVQKWFSDIFPDLLRDHFASLDLKTIFDILGQHICTSWLQEISKNDEELQEVWDIKSNDANPNPWLELWADIFAEKLSNFDFVKYTISSNQDLMEAYKKMMLNSIRTFDKKVWHTKCKIYIEQNKLDIKNEILKLDTYQAGKIVGESIRKYDKEQLAASLIKHINKYIEQEGITVIIEAISQNTNEENSIALKKRISLL